MMDWRSSERFTQKWSPCDETLIDLVNAAINRFNDRRATFAETGSRYDHEPCDNVFMDFEADEFQLIDLAKFSVPTAFV